MSNISPDEIKAILDSIPTDNQYDRRDLALLALLYDSAARVQELCDLQVRDVRLKKPYTVKLIGKRQKARCVPLMGKTIYIYRKYVAENRLNVPEKASHPFFCQPYEHCSYQGGSCLYIKEIL